VIWDRHSNFPQQASPHVSPTREHPVAEGATMCEKCPVILPKRRLPHLYIYRSFTCRKATTWDRRLYFPSEGMGAEKFFRPKNPTASAGCEPANLGTKGQHATSRPCKPLISMINLEIFCPTYNLK
jgi:hypothetical protein